MILGCSTFWQMDFRVRRPVSRLTLSRVHESKRFARHFATNELVIFLHEGYIRINFDRQLTITQLDQLIARYAIDQA